MGRIIQRDTDGAGANADKRLGISMEEYVRQLAESEWNTLRIGLRLSLNYRQTYGGTPKFAVGVCSTTNNSFAQATTNHFVGVISTSLNWTFEYSAINSAYYYKEIKFAPIVRVGTSDSIGSDYVADYHVQSWSNVDASLFIMEIRKGSPAWTICLKTSNASDGREATYQDHIDAMNADWNDIPLSAGPDAGITRTVDENTNGVLNTINIAWDRDRNMEIADLLVKRIS